MRYVQFETVLMRHRYSERERASVGDVLRHRYDLWVTIELWLASEMRAVVAYYTAGDSSFSNYQ